MRRYTVYITATDYAVFDVCERCQVASFQTRAEALAYAKNLNKGGRP